jgi:hypothetical protein
VRGVITHWTAGTNYASELDRRHYHFCLERDGRIVPGIRSIRDNCSPVQLDRGHYAGHTRARNSYRVGIAVCGMAGATESPFNPGKHPFTRTQWDVLAAVCADLLVTYDLDLSEQTCNSHFEQQRIWGPRYWQRGKWDISRLPWDPETPALVVANGFRSKVRDLLLPPDPRAHLILDGQDLSDRADVEIEDGATTLWLRPVAEAADLTILAWSPQEVRLLTEVGREVRVPVTVENGRSRVAARDLAAALGWGIRYQPDTRTVSLSSDAR